MTMLEVLGQLAAGFRVALVLFAAMIIIAGVRDRSWLAVCAAAICYSPAHAAWLMGHAAPRMLSTSLDAIASALACWGFIQLLAAEGARRGLSRRRIRAGIAANIIVAIGMVLCSWAFHA